MHNAEIRDLGGKPGADRLGGVEPMLAYQELQSAILAYAKSICEDGQHHQLVTPQRLYQLASDLEVDRAFLSSGGAVDHEVGMRAYFAHIASQQNEGCGRLTLADHMRRYFNSAAYKQSEYGRSSVGAAPSTVDGQRQPGGVAIGYTPCQLVKQSCVSSRLNLTPEVDCVSHSSYPTGSYCVSSGAF